MPRRVDTTYREELSVSGGRHEVLETLRRTVAAICRSDRTVRKFYIGIGSGRSAEEAMKRRRDDFKKENGVNEMICLYASTSQRFCRQVERELELYFRKQHSALINRRGGGGGRASEQPYFYVYLAVSRVGDPDR